MMRWKRLGSSRGRRAPTALEAQATGLQAAVAERKVVARRSTGIRRALADFRGLSLFEVNKRVSPLIAGGWLQAAQGGPDNRAWLVKAGVFDQFAERDKEERERKAKLAMLMNAPRKKTER